MRLARPLRAFQRGDGADQRRLITHERFDGQHEHESADDAGAPTDEPIIRDLSEAAERAKRAALDRRRASRRCRCTRKQRQRHQTAYGQLDQGSRDPQEGDAQLPLSDGFAVGRPSPAAPWLRSAARMAQAGTGSAAQGAP